MNSNIYNMIVNTKIVHSPVIIIMIESQNVSLVVAVYVKVNIYPFLFLPYLWDHNYQTVTQMNW